MLKKKESKSNIIKFNDIMTDEVKAEIIFQASFYLFRVFRFLIVAGIIFSIFIPAINQDSSMQPTIYENDISIYIKGNRNIKRGNIVTFINQDGIRCSKRVIGLPGDILEFKKGKVYINGMEFKKDYVKGKTFGHNYDKIKIPEGSYFLLGDNRLVSVDSREIGPVKGEDIVGKLLFKIPTNKIAEKF